MARHPLYEAVPPPPSNFRVRWWQWLLILLVIVVLLVLLGAFLGRGFVPSAPGGNM